MSAEVLRRAAALMRERAQKAPKETRTSGATTGVWLNSAYHLTTTPAVALLVADLLEAKAEQDAKGACDAAPGPCNHCEHDYTNVAASALARAYLNEPAP